MVRSTRAVITGYKSTKINTHNYIFRSVSSLVISISGYPCWSTLLVEVGGNVEEAWSSERIDDFNSYITAVFEIVIYVIGECSVLSKTLIKGLEDEVNFRKDGNFIKSQKTDERQQSQEKVGRPGCFKTSGGSEKSSGWFKIYHQFELQSKFQQNSFLLLLIFIFVFCCPQFASIPP